MTREEESVGSVQSPNDGVERVHQERALSGDKR